MFRWYVGRAVAVASVCGVVVVALSSCTTSRIRAYPGAELPSDRVALLRPQSGANSPNVYFVRIDDKSFPKPQYSAIEILPGSHDVEFGYEALGYQSFGQIITRAWSTQNARVRFEGEAGHEYEVRVQPFGTASVALGSSETGHWIGYVVDVSSGKIVGSSPRKQ